MKWTYLLVDLFTVLVPFLFSFHAKIRFDKQFKFYFLANLGSASIFLLWDYFFTKWNVWSFNEQYLLGFNIAGLPIEEILFFFCIPFACVFTYYCFTRFFSIQWTGTVRLIIILLLSLILLFIGITNIERAYTGLACISSGLLLMLLHFYWKVKWLDMALCTYAVLLIPFFIVNGILTGTGLDEPVVIYNDAENLGIRLITIPVEDVAYGFELFLLTVFFYENVKKQNLLVQNQGA